MNSPVTAEPKPLPLTIAVLGASGHVGSRVVRDLLSLPAGVVAGVITLNRRVLAEGTFPQSDRLSSHVVDMSSAEALEAGAGPLLVDTDVVVATMGIGSGIAALKKFRHVEVALPSAFARAAAAAGVRRAVLLTASGADIENRFSFLLPHVARGQYFHLKGLIEQHFAEAGFPEGVVIFRPGGLLGTDHLPYWVDGLMARIDWILPAHFRCIHIDHLAYSMAQATADPAGVGAADSGLSVVGTAALFAMVRGDRLAPRASLLPPVAGDWPEVPGVGG